MATQHGAAVCPAVRLDVVDNYVRLLGQVECHGGFVFGTVEELQLFGGASLGLRRWETVSGGS
jgi:hypothetical protein